MEYISLTQEEQDLAMARELHARELEHFHYSINEARYNNILNAMPKKRLANEDWPDDLKVFKKLSSREDIVKVLKNDPETAEAVLNLQYEDRIKHLAMTEKYEKEKVEQIHAQVVAHFGEDKSRLEIALAAAKAEREGY